MQLLLLLQREPLRLQLVAQRRHLRLQLGHQLLQPAPLLRGRRQLRLVVLLLLLAELLGRDQVRPQLRDELLDPDRERRYGGDHGEERPVAPEEHEGGGCDA